MSEPFWIECPGLVLVETPQAVLRQRLLAADFHARVALGAGPQQVFFPAEWPGDALVLFPWLLDAYARDPQHREWGGTLIDTAELVAVGQLGCKGRPDADGAVEIGYGINPNFQRRGYATVGVRALVGWLFAQPTVRTVTAECRVDNPGSIRVLEKTGFVRTGAREDPEDGALFCWAQSRG